MTIYMYLFNVFFFNLLYTLSNLSVGIHMWRNQQKDTANVQQTAIEAMQHYKDILPNIETLKQLFSIVCVTSVLQNARFLTLKESKPTLG